MIMDESIPEELISKLYPSLTNEERTELMCLSVKNNLSVVDQLRVMALTGIVNNQEHSELINDINACDGVITIEQAVSFIERVLRV